MMLMVMMSPMETSGVYGEVEVALVRGLRRVVNGFVDGCILLSCRLFTFCSLKGVGIFGSSGGRVLVVVVVVWGRGKGFIRIYTAVYGCLFLTGDLNLRLCMVGIDCPGRCSILP